MDKPLFIAFVNKNENASIILFIYKNALKMI